MKTDEGTENDEENKGGRAQRGKEAREYWPWYTDQERALLQKRFLAEDWESLEFMGDFWESVYGDKDLMQYRELATVWRLRLSGKTFNDISKELRMDAGKAGGYFTGYNRRTYLSDMYLNHEMLAKPREGWKWVLECTPKPTNQYPIAVQVPAQIRSYLDILDFLRQFPRIPESNQNLSFFGVSSEWVEAHKPELFCFVLAFLVGDGGKYYSEYENRGRHYNKSAMTTNMKRIESNYRVLRYVQLGLQCVGIQSGEIEANQLPNGYEIIRWNSVHSNLITWIMRVCLGLKKGERTSRNPLDMSWLNSCPKEFITAFMQGIADSDGHVHKTRNYAEIASIPNAVFYYNLIRTLGFDAKKYPLDHSRIVRTDLSTAATIPLFNPIVKSYRYEKLITRISQRTNPPLPPSFLFHCVGLYRASR